MYTFEAMERVPVNQARRRFADILGRAQYAGEITLITKHDKEIAAVVPTDLLSGADQSVPKKKAQRVARGSMKIRAQKS